MVTIAFICFFIAGFCKAVSDTLADHYSNSIFSRFNPWYWNKNLSWTNKYSTHMVANGAEKKEKFFLSTSILVFTTDGWHLFNFLNNTAICLGAICLGINDIKYSILEWILIGVILKCFYTLAFTLGYDIIFPTKKDE